jgi:hypothetical protein
MTAALVPNVNLSGTSTPREVNERSLSGPMPSSKFIISTPYTSNRQMPTGISVVAHFAIEREQRFHT